MIVGFVHGWGGDRTIWQAVIARLPEFDCRCEDRGYFGDPRPMPDAAIMVTHSFGTMRVLADPPPAARALIAINSFDCFTARDGFPGVPPRVVERMLSRFGADDRGVLNEFRARCGAPPHTGNIVSDTLRADLSRLRDDDARGLWPGHLTVLHAADDPIVPPPMQVQTFASKQANRLTLPTGGHLLPLTDPEACARAIRDAAGKLA